DDVSKTKLVYIFRKDGKLIISKNGKVKIGNWEYLGNDSLLLDLKEEAFLFRQGFFDENVLALKIDSKNEYDILINETKFGQELNNLIALNQFLKENYLTNTKFQQKINKFQIENDGTREFRITDGFKEGFATVINHCLDYAFIDENKRIVT